MSVILWLLCLVVVCCILIRIIQYYLSQIPFYKLASKLPGPPTVPILGNAHLFIGKSEDILNKAALVAKQYPVFRFWFGPKLSIFIRDADKIGTILSSQKMTHKDDNIYRVLYPFIGQGLISGSGPRWKSHRKLIVPMFSKKILTNYFQILQDESKILVDKLSVEVDGPTFRVDKYIHNCSFDITCETITDVKIKSQSGMNTEIVYWLDRMYYLVFNRIMKIWLYPDLIYYRTHYAKQEKKSMDVITTFLQNAINIKRSELKERKKYEQEKNEKVSTLELFLETMEKDPESFTETELIYELNTLFNASQDPMATITSFMVQIFGMYPEYQRKAVLEIQEVLGNIKNPFTNKDLSKLHFLEMCIKEVLRLFPIGPFILRKTTENFALDDNITLPEGCSVIVGIYSVHRDPEHWEKPEEFYPYHFNPETAGKRHPYAYLPFSSGPRSCIGQVYAFMAIKVIVVNILKEYEIEADVKLEDLKLKTDISVRPVHGHNIRLKRRNTST